MILPALLGVLLGLLAAPPSKPSLVIVQERTDWHTSRACPGAEPAFAASIGAGLVRALEVRGRLRITPFARLKQRFPSGADPADAATRAKLQKAHPASLYLAIRFRCEADRALLELSAHAGESGEIVWSKVQTVAVAAQLEETLVEIARQLSAFVLGEGGGPAPQPKTEAGSLVIFPLEDTTGRFKPDQLAAIQAHLRGELRKAGFQSIDARGRCSDQACVFEEAGRLGGELALSIQLKVEEKQECALSLTLFALASRTVTKTATVQVACAVMELKAGIEQIAAQLRG